MYKRGIAGAYVTFVGVPVLVLLAVLRAGSGLNIPVVLVSQHQAELTPSPLNLANLMLQIAVILAVARLAGMLFKRIGQPQVVGEMFAGILLGPSLFGAVAPSLYSLLFPAASLGYLHALSQFGLVLFMFGVGVSLDHAELHNNRRTALVTSHASIATPFCLGSGLALFLYPRLSTTGVGFTSFALFLGAAMSITAFPVLARILQERNLLRTRMGTLAMACAAIDDATGWCILAYIVMFVQVRHAAAPWVPIVGALAYVLAMFFAVRPLLPRFEAHFRKHGRISDQAYTWIVVLLLVSAVATQQLGLHLVFGAFLMGALMPKDEAFVHALRDKFDSLAVHVLLPLFFAYSGLRTNLGALGGFVWVYALLATGVAIAGKFGGSMLAARMAGIPMRDAASLGILMNTRGLMELVVLNIGLDIGIISPTVFTIMVLMALTTTFMTSPLLELVYPTRLALVRSVEAKAPVA
jgi:Kef-type K+ transport system membrane component KefB